MRRFALLSFFTIFSVAAQARDLTRYAVILNDPPAVTVATRGDRPALDRARASVRGSHEAVKAELRSRGVQVTGEIDTLLNAIFVAADVSQVDQIKTVAGVGYVVKMPRFHMALDAAVKLINVPAAWNLLGGTGNAGAGVKIGIIDTGIEATHAAFQDSSLTPPAGFPICPVMSDCAFTNGKIIVARNYVSMVAAGSGSNPAADSRPDDYSARDRVGHGTAVAMAAAGMTNTGPADTITGAAPKAFLGNYKIFGSPGINDSTSGDAILSALEDAYNDGMDIVNLSFGAPAFSGPLDTGTTCGLSRAQICDPIASAVQNAATATPGMIVVVAAGNDGSSLGTITSPGDAPAAIGVAATTNSHIWSNAFTVNGVVYQSQLGNGPVPATLTGPLSDVASVGDPQACSAVPANSLSGSIALVQRGTCTFAVKVQNLQIAGAIGAVITNNPGDDSLIEPGGLGGTSIPAAFIGYDDGQTIRAFLQGHPNAPASVNPNVAAFSVSTFNQVAPFSSRGPVLGSGGLKPDVAAVGTDLYLAAQNYDPNGDLYSANGYIVSQGTSFSTPQIAGIAALVKQAHPGLAVAQVRSAIVDTASQSNASLLAAGAGIANAASAVATNLVASSASVSFGIVKTGSLPITQAIQLSNIGGAALTLSVSINRITAENNAKTSINLPNVTVAAGQTATVGLTLSGTVPSPGIYQGFVTIQGAANTLQIPYMYVVGDGVPAEIIPVAGNGDTGIAGQSNSEGLLLLQLLDQYGIPVQNAAVKFSATSGGGKITASDSLTDNYGFGAADDTLGPVAGTNVFTATAGGLSTTFTITSSYQPAISPNGSYNAANFQQGQPVAAGSLVSLYGANLSTGTQTFSTPYFPISLDGVSVSFDAGTISVPGRLLYVSPGQVNIQVPWELQGQTSAQIKVSIGENSGALYNLPIGNYSPAFFEYPAGSAAAQDQNYHVVGTSNPVAQGSVVQLFVNGLGPVANQPGSGNPVPLNVQATTPTTPIVMIGGQNAQVIFSGLAPGFAGLYQVNAVVPSVGAGVQPITISIGGVQSTTSHIAVK